MVSQIVWFIVVIVSIIIAYFLSRILLKIMNKKSIKKLMKDSDNNPDFLMDAENKKEVDRNETWKKTEGNNRREELERELEDEQERLRDIKEIRQRDRNSRERDRRELEVPKPDGEDFIGGEQPIETTDNSDQFEGRRTLPTESSDDVEGHKPKFKWD